MIAGAARTAVAALVPFDGRAVDAPCAPLDETIARLRRCARVSSVYVVHNDAPPTVDAQTIQVAAPVLGATRARAIAARKWATTCWRGGLGGATVFDEVIEPAAMHEAMTAAGIDSGLIVGPNWVRVDADLCDQVIARHLGEPAAHKLVFTQAPPGLCGAVIARSLLGDLAEHGAMAGGLLAYQPRAPQGDPIARDVCVGVPAGLRQARIRAIADHERWRTALAATDPSADALTVAQSLALDAATPSQVNIELTPFRNAAGPITPQHHAMIDRQPMPLDRFKSIIEQLRGIDDVALRLGGIGDALCHDEWRACIDIARDGGVWGVCIETDLLCDRRTLAALAESPIDAVVVRVNADDPERYAALMGVDGHGQLIGNLQWLITHRTAGLPWVVPSMVKTTANVDQLEMFVDRWTLACGHALVLGPSTGRGAMPDQSVIAMPQPAGYVAAGRATAMHVLSDGKVVDEDDWLAGAPLGDLSRQSLAEVWQRRQASPAAGAA